MANLNDAYHLAGLTKQWKIHTIFVDGRESISKHFSPLNKSK